MKKKIWLKKLDSPQNQQSYKGYNLQILENTDINFVSSEDTINIIFQKEN